MPTLPLCSNSDRGPALVVAQEKVLTWCDVFAPQDDPTTVESVPAAGQNVTSLLARSDGAVVMTCGVPPEVLSGASGGGQDMGTASGGGGMTGEMHHAHSRQRGQGQGQGLGWAGEKNGQELGDGHDGPNGDGPHLHDSGGALGEGHGHSVLHVHSPNSKSQEFGDDVIGDGDGEGMGMMVGIPTGMHSPSHPSAAYRNSEGSGGGGGGGGSLPSLRQAGAQGVVLARRPSDPQCYSSTGSHQIICLASEPLLGARWVGSQVRACAVLTHSARAIRTSWPNSARLLLIFHDILLPP
jgi:hypothetical protein